MALFENGSIVKRALTRLKRISSGEQTVFTGGVVKNQCITKLANDGLNQTIMIPDDPQNGGANGAVLLTIA